MSVWAAAARESAGAPHASLCCVLVGIMKEKTLLLVRGRYFVYALWIHPLQQKRVTQKEIFLVLLQPESQKTKLIENHSLFTGKI